MNIQNTDRQKSVRLVSDEGRGAMIVFLREESAPSKSAEILARDFRVVSLALSAGVTAADIADAVSALGVTEAAIIADTANATAALELALARPPLVQSLALVAPPPLAGDLAGRVSGVTMPALALYGTRDAARPADAARAFCGAFPNCGLMYVYAGVRALDDERPEAVATVLAAFALKREKFLVTGKSSRLYP